MNAITGRWNHFWFAPQPTSTLALLRIAVGTLTVAWALNLAPDTTSFFGPGGLGGGYALAPLVITVLLVAAVCLTIGLATRVAAGVVLACMVWLVRVNPLVWNTGDVLLRHLVLFLVLAPSGESLSVDRFRRHRTAFWDHPTRAPWALRLVQLQVVVMYVTTVNAKLHGWTWRHGVAVSYPLRIPSDARFALPTAITASTGWAHVLTWGTLAVEGAIPLLVWNRRTRPYVLALGVGLHLAIDLTLRVGFFSWIVLAAYLAFVPPEQATALVDRVRNGIRELVAAPGRSSRRWRRGTAH